MRVALVHDWLTGMRGGEKCLESLCRLWPDAHLYTLLHQRGCISPIIESRPIHTSFLQQIPGSLQHHRWFLPLMPAAIRNLKLPDNYDVVISLSHAFAKGIAVPPSVPHICYCFTPMRWAWHRFDDYFGGASARRSAFRQVGTGKSALATKLRGAPISLSNSMLRSFMASMRRWDRGTSENVTHFVAISKTIAGRIRECYDRASTVIYPPVDTDFYTPEPDVTREVFYLCVSALVPYKRVDVAVQACTRLNRALVVIGKGPENAKLAKMAGPTVRFLGWQSDEVIRDHFRRCRALLFPGNEDFGIVPVEAQACGTPIIAYGRGGATETVIPAGESRTGTGVIFSRQTTECLIGSMQWLERHPGRFSAELGRRNAMRYARRRYEQEMCAYVAAVHHSVHKHRRRIDPATTELASPHTIAEPAAVDSRSSHPLQAKRGRRFGKIAPPLLVALSVLAGAAIPGAVRAGIIPEKIDLPALNKSLAGRVLDFTQNHGGDYRVCSAALNQYRDLYVYVPPRFSRRHLYPLVVWLHGYGGDERQFLRQAVRALDCAIVKGKLPPVIAAAPDGSLRGNFRLYGHGSWYTNSKHGRFEDYITHDVMAFLQERFPIDPDPALHVVIGWSMGGYGAYKIGMRFPDKFRILVGIYPNLDMRWCDRDGHYSTDFDPAIADQYEVLPRWKLMGIVPTIQFPVTFDWAIGRIWGHGREAMRRISAENPVEVLARRRVRNGQFDLLVAYGKQDEYNVDAQVESFLHRAGELGINVWVRYDPQGHHTSEYVTECLPDVWMEVGHRLRRNWVAVHAVKPLESNAPVNPAPHLSTLQSQP